MDIQIDHKFIIETLSKLVKINSINPSLSPDGLGEAEIGGYVAEVLSDLGLDVILDEIKPGRVNVIGIRKGTGGGKSLLLNAHMDTVGVDGMASDPFKPDIRDGKLYGRGAQDMKGSLAAMIGAVKALVDNGIELAGDLMVTGVADEEYGSMGTEALVKQVTADAAIVTEPTDLNIGLAHHGFIWYEVDTFGRAAHGSRYDEGIDATMRMGRFLAALDGLEQDLRNRDGHPLVGPPSLHAARIQGGTEISMYAAHCRLEIERRTTPGETEPEASAEIQALIDQLSAQDPTFKARLKPAFVRDPFEIDSSCQIVGSLEAGFIEQMDRKPTYAGQSFWTDAALFSEAGIETVLIGPKGGGLHSKEEWVDIQSVLNLAGILARTTIFACQKN